MESENKNNIFVKSLFSKNKKKVEQNKIRNQGNWISVIWIHLTIGYDKIVSIKCINLSNNFNNKSKQFYRLKEIYYFLYLSSSWRCKSNQYSIRHKYLMFMFTRNFRRLNGTYVAIRSKISQNRTNYSALVTSRFRKNSNFSIEITI